MSSLFSRAFIDILLWLSPSSAMDSNESNAFFPAPVAMETSSSLSGLRFLLDSERDFGVDFFISLFFLFTGFSILMSTCSAADINESNAFFPAPVATEMSSLFSRAFIDILLWLSPSSAMDSNESNAFFPAPVATETSSSLSIAVPCLVLTVLLGDLRFPFVWECNRWGDFFISLFFFFFAVCCFFLTTFSFIDCASRCCSAFFPIPLAIEASSLLGVSDLVLLYRSDSSLEENPSTSPSAMDINERNAFSPAPVAMETSSFVSNALHWWSPPPPMDSNESNAFFPAPVATEMSSFFSDAFFDEWRCLSPPAMESNDSKALFPAPVATETSSPPSIVLLGTSALSSFTSPSSCSSMKASAPLGRFLLLRFWALVMDKISSPGRLVRCVPTVSKSPNEATSAYTSRTFWPSSSPFLHSLPSFNTAFRIASTSPPKSNRAPLIDSHSAEENDSGYVRNDTRFDSAGCCSTSLVGANGLLLLKLLPVFNPLTVFE